MSKSREKIQQIGFWDDEVSKPNHDEICMWAYQNADAIIQIAYPEECDRLWRLKDIHFNDSDESQDKNIIERANKFINSNPRPNPRSSTRTIECVLVSRTGYRDQIEKTVGYADLLLNIEFPYLVYHRQSGDFKVSWSLDDHHVLVEAKSVLPTIGELMRQIQLYRTAFRGKFVVVSPDSRYAQILAEQNVIFVQYQKDMK